MNDTEKQRECERICGESGKRGIHRIAPEICPLELDRWRNPKKYKEQVCKDS